MDEDKYNYITATYYLLAEKLLKKHCQKRTKRKLNTNFKPIVIPLNDSLAINNNNNNNNDAQSVNQFKSIAKNTINNVNKSNYSNKAMRNSKLVRQDEANEQENEETEQIAKKSSDEAKQPEEIILVSQTPLTNILEDEEEPFDEEINFKPDLSNLILINNNNNTNNTNNAPPLMTNSRRSSRGGENTITALTILEENESDHFSVNSFNNINVNNTIRMSNSKLKLYPYSANKQTSDESNFSFYYF